MSNLARCVVIDPPWKFNDKLPGKKRGAEKHYKTQTVEEMGKTITSWRLSHTSIPTAFNILWRVASMQREALELVDRLSLVVKSEIVWVKTPKRTGVQASSLPEPRLHFGMGRYVRNCHEVALICTPKGSRTPRVLNHSTRSVFFAPVGEHSEKPQEFYDLVSNLFPGPYLDLYARKSRPGWIALGNEVQNNG